MSFVFDTQDMPFRDIHDKPSWIRLQQVRMLYGNSTMSMLGTLFCAFSMVVLLWPVAAQDRLILWFAAIGSVTLARLYLAQRFESRADKITDPGPWFRTFQGGVVLSGACWGGVSIWLFPLDSPMHQVYIAFVLSGICAGAVTVYAPLPGTFLAFAVPGLLPYLWRIWSIDTPQTQLMAGLGALFIIVLNRIGVQSGKTLRSVLELQVRNAELTNELHHQATHDSLVNLINHGEFQRRLKRVAGKSAGPNLDFALIFLDLDLFKTVNDTGGHSAGDALLREIAEILRAHTRARDTAARVGGDEFALLLENCPPERALQIAEYIRRDIAELRLEFEGHQYRVGASLGVAYGKTGLNTASSALKAADAACYAAKEAGRNRVRMLPADDMFKTTGRFHLAEIAAS